ncbi:MAG: hypothetical protein V1923_03690 [Candidatus Omnitrophota bacterium]
MWYTDPFTLILSFFVTIICIVLCGIGVIFTFCLDIFVKWDKKANWWIIPSIILTPLEKNINSLDEWLKSKHKIVGPLLIILSLTDLVMFFSIVDKFKLAQV